MGAGLKSARPFMIAFTAAMLAASFFYAYVRRPSRRNKTIAWLAAAVSVGAIIAGRALGH